MHAEVSWANFLYSEDKENVARLILWKQTVAMGGGWNWLRIMSKGWLWYYQCWTHRFCYKSHGEAVGWNKKLGRLITAQIITTRTSIDKLCNMMCTWQCHVGIARMRFKFLSIHVNTCIHKGTHDFWFPQWCAQRLWVVLATSPPSKKKA